MSENVSDSKEQEECSENVRKKHNNCYSFTSEVNSKIDEPPINERGSKVPEFEGENAQNTAYFRKARENKNQAHRTRAKMARPQVPRFGTWCSEEDDAYTTTIEGTLGYMDPEYYKESKNYARTPLLDVEFLNQRTLGQQMRGIGGEDSGGGGGRRLVHDQRNNNGVFGSHGENTSRELVASSPIPKTSLNNPNELQRPQGTTRNINIQKYKEPGCFSWFGRG